MSVERDTQEKRYIQGGDLVCVNNIYSFLPLFNAFFSIGCWLLAVFLRRCYHSLTNTPFTFSFIFFISLSHTIFVFTLFVCRLDVMCTNTYYYKSNRPIIHSVVLLFYICCLAVVFCAICAICWKRKRCQRKQKLHPKKSSLVWLCQIPICATFAFIILSIR